MNKKAIIIGSGFAGLSAASFLAKAGWEVTVLDKQSGPGGRAGQWIAEGFRFDMGPSWYWMPEVFDRYFAQFGKKTGDYYTLQRLDPSYRIYDTDGAMDIPADYEALKRLFASIEKGADHQLDRFLNGAAYKYRVGMEKLVFRPGRSLTEFLDRDLLTGLFKLDVFRSMRSHVKQYFRHQKLRRLMEFPVLFLGAMPDQIPALYSLMNYADIRGGTWYPEKGMYQVVEAMYTLALALGVRFHFEEAAEAITVQDHVATGVVTNRQGNRVTHTADAVIAAADYHHVETCLLPAQYRSYSDAYWNKRVMAPSCLLYYVGLSTRLSGITHHSLFLDADFDMHGRQIYHEPQWPSNPLFYACASAVTDPGAAPAGCENLFLLVPVAAGLQNDDEALREDYFRRIIRRMEKHTGQQIEKHIMYKKTFANSDFVYAYNSFKGNAYGLANTLLQTALLKPACKSKKVSNLFFTGQLTVPGPGVPPSLISGEVVAGEVQKMFDRKK